MTKNSYVAEVPFKFILRHYILHIICKIFKECLTILGHHPKMVKKFNG